jgi:hypothetical protein
MGSGIIAGLEASLIGKVINSTIDLSHDYSSVCDKMIDYGLIGAGVCLGLIFVKGGTDRGIEYFSPEQKKIRELVKAETERQRIRDLEERLDLMSNPSKYYHQETNEEIRLRSLRD